MNRQAHHAELLAFKPVLMSVDADLSIGDLERRFSRAPKAPVSIICEPTRDAGYLFQYYRLRDAQFSGAHAGRQDAQDMAGEIIVARIGHHVIGGCRVHVSQPAARRALPMEGENFSLEAALPQLADEGYGEISRMAMLPDYMDGVAALELLRRAFVRAAERGARQVLALSAPGRGENFRKAAMLFGLKWQQLSGFAVPDREEYEGARMQAGMADIAALAAKSNTKTAAVRLVGA